MNRGVLWRKSPTPCAASLQIFGHLPQISPPLQRSVQRSRTSSLLDSTHLLCASYPVWSPDLYLDSPSHSDEQQPIIPEEIRRWLWVCSLYPPVNHRLKRWRLPVWCVTTEEEPLLYFASSLFRDLFFKIGASSLTTLLCLTLYIDFKVSTV